MDLLSRAAKLLLVAAALAVAGCLVARHFGWTDPGPGFPHAKHGEEAGLECSSCHRTAETGEEAGMPSLKQCRLCHEELDEGKPPERQAAAFFADGAPRTAPRARLSDEILFSHQVHVTEYQVACSECHGDVSASEAVSDNVRVSMADCMECHTRAGRKNDCAECHREIRKDVAPASHALDWRRGHGRGFRVEPDEARASCLLCHARRDCETCHRTELPANHTNYWRRRGHGVAVAIDRSRCATCHQSDACERCHQESAPISHAAGWGSPRDRHCLGCHAPLGAEQGCGVCHRSTPSHALAAPLPPDHTPGMNCRQCHGLTAPLPHPDKGDSCSACHR